MNWPDSNWFQEWLRLARLLVPLMFAMPSQAVDIYAVHTNGTHYNTPSRSSNHSSFSHWLYWRNSSLQVQ